MESPKEKPIFSKDIKGKAREEMKKLKTIKETAIKRVKNIKNNKKINNDRVKYIGLSLVVVFLVAILAYQVNRSKMRAYEVYLGEDKMGIVRDEGLVTSLMEDLGEELKNTYNMEIVLKKDIKLEEVFVKDEEIISEKDLKDGIKSKITFLVEAYSLKVNGDHVGSLKTREEIEEVLNGIKASYGEDGEDLKIVEDFEIVKEEIPIFKVIEGEKLENILLTSAEEIKTHTVEVGESLWTIAKIYNMDVDDLIAANTDKTPESLQIGDEVKLLMEKPLITVEGAKEVEYIETVNYDQEINYDDSMYTNEKKILVEGQSGEKKVKALEKKQNGRLVHKEILEEEIIKEPVPEKIVKGTKEVPKTMATGAFIMPTRGRISSRYGMRNGRMHRGLDIAASTGTQIKAADGGTVVFTGYRGAYGNLVEIDHGNGYKTRYAHCSKILVKTGDKVYKGQHIANVGNTGRSTGPHLHLEVLKNGQNQNPSNYVK